MQFDSARGRHPHANIAASFFFFFTVHRVGVKSLKTTTTGLVPRAKGEEGGGNEKD